MENRNVQQTPKQTKAMSFILELPKGFRTINNEKDPTKTTILPTKTALAGLIGAVASIKRGTPEMYQLYDFLIYCEPFKSKIWLETDPQTGNQYVVNRNGKQPLRLRVIAIPTTDQTVSIMKKFLRNARYVKDMSQKKHLYLGQNAYPVRILKARAINVVKQTQARTFSQRYIIPTFGVELLEPAEKWIKIRFPVRRKMTGTGDVIETIPVYTTRLDRPLRIKAHESYYIPDEERYFLPV